MSIVAAMCSQCGANISVDNAKDAGICEHCGTAFVTEKIIHQYNTIINNHLVVDDSVDMSILSGKAQKDAEDNIGRAYQIKDMECFKKLTADYVDKYPMSYLGYKYSIMVFSAYNQFKSDKYDEYLHNYAEFKIIEGMSKHAIELHYYNMLDRMNSEEMESNAEFIRTVEIILKDYDRVIAQLSQKSIRKTAVKLAITAISIAAIVMLCVFAKMLDQWYGLVFVILFSVGHWLQHVYGQWGF